MSQITTHILNTAIGKPAADVAVILYNQQGEAWDALAGDTTDTDGRITELLDDALILPAGIYKLRFDTQAYFTAIGVNAFYPMVEIIFEINGNGEHYHVPLLLNPFGYSTYRGS